MADLDVSALQGIDVHVHVESDGHGQLSLDDELLAASAKYFKAENDRAPTVEQIAAALEISPAQTWALQMAGRSPVSLDEPCGEDGQKLESLLPDAQAAEASDPLDQRLLRERLDEVLGTLAPRDRAVLELRFGLRDGRPRSLEAIAQEFGLTRERIRQIENRGLLRLRHPERKGMLADFVERG